MKNTDYNIKYPRWLLQVPSRQLSSNCKLIYGYLASVADQNGTIRANVNEISQAIGTVPKTIEDGLKQLREKGLIGAQGIGAYEFYHHPWMDR